MTISKMNIKIQLPIIFVILALEGSDFVLADEFNPDSPIYLVYKHGDLLHLEISLKNVPPEASDYFEYYDIDNCAYNRFAPQKSPVPQCKRPAKRQKLPRDGKISIKHTLYESLMTITIELRRGDEFCASKTFITGKMDAMANGPGPQPPPPMTKQGAGPPPLPPPPPPHMQENTFDSCMNREVEPCIIFVKFENKCEDVKPQAPSNYCSVVDLRVTCESPNEDLPKNTVHQWHQYYSNDSYKIGKIPLVRGKRSRFIMKLENFDNNTTIIGKTSTNVLTSPSKILVERKEYEIKNKMLYSESKPITFTCEKKVHTEIGWINTSGYRIKTYDMISFTKTLSKTDNGSMLCCLKYSIYGAEDKMFVERVIEKMTLLIHQEPVRSATPKTSISMERNEPQESWTPRVTPKTILSPPVKLSATKTATKAPEITKDSKNVEASVPKNKYPLEEPWTQQNTQPPNLDNQIITNPSILGNQTQPPSSQLGDTVTSSGRTKYYIIVAVAGLIILISIIYVIIKKYWRKTSDIQQSVQLETYGTSNMVLYAELDVRPSGTPAPGNTDTTYAEIIGVLKPDTDVKK